MLEPRGGSAATGSVSFEQRGGRIVVTAEVRGLKPNSEHGFHVHERGDCSAPDAMSAGGHFNPKTQPHGNHAAGAHHAGDMPNLRADANGVARLVWEDDELAVSAGPASVVGKAVVVHRDPDDYRSQPAGNSGPRIACGVVTRS
jgi:Cu-Zn family superoxide dismutase